MPWTAQGQWRWSIRCSTRYIAYLSFHLPVKVPIRGRIRGLIKKSLNCASDPHAPTSPDASDGTCLGVGESGESGEVGLEKARAGMAGDRRLELVVRTYYRYLLGRRDRGGFRSRLGVPGPNVLCRLVVPRRAGSMVVCNGVSPATRIRMTIPVSARKINGRFF